MTVHDPVTARGALRPPADALLLATVLAEIRETASEAEERGFLLAVGRRIAASHPLPDFTEPDRLEQAMNDMFDRLDLGRVRLTLGRDGVDIAHSLSADLRSPERHAAAPAILEGTYAGWFAAIGHDRLVLRRLSSAEGRLRFHYGR